MDLFKQNKKEVIKILNVYVPSNRASRYMKQKLTELHARINKSTILVRDFNTPLSVIDSRDAVNP